MRVYIPALIVTSLIGALFVGLFFYWKDQSFPRDSEIRVLSLEEMEKSGIPSFSAKTVKGEGFQLLEAKGKLVVLNFWASWCGPCVEEFPSLLKLAEAMKGNLILVAVSGDSSEEDMKKFLLRLKDWDRPWVKIIWDEDQKISKAYQIERLPESFIADRNQLLIRKIIGSINWYTPESVQYMNEMLKR